VLLSLPAFKSYVDRIAEGLLFILRIVAKYSSAFSRNGRALGQ
jgi:hypothetical protein